MRYTIWILLFFLSACSVHHDIKIKNQPCLCPYQGYEFILCRNFNYLLDGNKHSIPVGFKTDLASIPKILWSIYAPNKANTIAAAVIHDYLYMCPEHLSRTDVDRILYDALVYGGVNKKRATLYWLGVRAFGRKHFNEDARCSTMVTRIDSAFGRKLSVGVV